MGARWGREAPPEGGVRGGPPPRLLASARKIFFRHTPFYIKKMQKIQERSRKYPDIFGSHSLIILKLGNPRKYNQRETKTREK